MLQKTGRDSFRLQRERAKAGGYQYPCDCRPGQPHGLAGSDSRCCAIFASSRLHGSVE